MLVRKVFYTDIPIHQPFLMNNANIASWSSSLLSLSIKNLIFQSYEHSSFRYNE